LVAGSVVGLCCVFVALHALSQQHLVCTYNNVHTHLYPVEPQQQIAQKHGGAASGLTQPHGTRAAAV
jgi:hypothetical protein